MQTSKIQYSTDELKLAENSELILTKNRIIKKTIALFASLAEKYRSESENHRAQLPSEIFEQAPKISRGEQYLELPYVMLDYPRVFSKENVFAIRSFFWWGNYFSITLHLKGVYKEMYRQKIKERYNIFSQNNYCMAISDDEWRHDFVEQHYLTLTKEGLEKFEESMEEGTFLKLAAKWPLQQGNEIQPLFQEQFSTLLNVLSG